MNGSEEGRLLSLVDALAGRRVAIIGDIIADEFIYGEIARVSREAPVLILNYDSTEVVPGMTSIAGDRARSQASAIRAGLQPCASAIGRSTRSDSGAPGTSTTWSRTR